MTGIVCSTVAGYGVRKHTAVSRSIPSTTVSVPFQAHDGDGSLRLITHEDDEPLECWTFVPETFSSDERYTAWISADSSEVVDLEEWR